MKAVVYTHCRPIDAEDALLDTSLPDPVPRKRDLLVEVRAVAVNPVDTKLRRHADPVGEKRVLGFDAAGVVRALGAEVTHFGIGDEVWYAGAINRAGANAEYQLVDERLVGRKPRRLGFADAASMPLTSLTAFEMLFDRLQVPQAAAGSLLIIGGAGGVGSIAIQLARRAGFTVIATASRSETIAWCRSLGAQHLIDHRQPLRPQLQALGFAQVDVVLNLADTDRYWDAVGELLAPQGHVGLIVEPTGALRIGDPYKAKAIGIHWEMMFARPRFKTADQAEQGRILDRVATLIDAGALRGTRTVTLAPINAANLREAHRRLESGSTIGKLVLAGW